MRRVKISVTQGDIDRGKRKECADCPVALAVLRETGIPGVRVFGDIIDLKNKPDQTYPWTMNIPLPRSVLRFVVRFDRGKSVAPFKFFLNVP